jgi:hypothetical protein
VILLLPLYWRLCFCLPFFLASLHSSLAPIVLGGIWPPRWIGILGPQGIPFVTVIFLYIAAVTSTSHAMQCIRYSICFDFFYCSECFAPFFFWRGEGSAGASSPL